LLNILLLRGSGVIVGMDVSNCRLLTACYFVISDGPDAGNTAAVSQEQTDSFQ